MAGNIQVGKPECTFNQLVLAIEGSRGYATLVENWTRLARALEIHEATISTLRTSLLFNKSLTDVLTHIIMEWVNRRNLEATLENLIAAFDLVGFHDIGVTLREKFVKESTSSPPASSEGNVAVNAAPPIQNVTTPTVNIFVKSSAIDAATINLFQLRLEELTYTPYKFSSSLQEAEDGNELPESFVESTDTIDFTTARSFTKRDLKIVRPRHVMQFDVDHYKLKENEKGLALVLNIFEYEKKKYNRHGAKFDSFYMEEVWEQLGYKVTVEDEGTFTKARVEKIMKKFRDKCNKKKPRSAVVFIGGHGEFGQLVLSNLKDCVHIYRDIINKFTTEKCPGLDGKPKIFIISACQEWGSIDELPIPVESPSATESVDGPTSSKRLRQTPPLDDTIVCYSTVPGFYSHRYGWLGTAYIYCLTKIMIEEAHRMHFKEIHDLVEKTMATVITRKPINQRPNYHLYGFKELYFHVLP